MQDTVALNAAIDAFSEQAIGSDDGELARQRSLALRAFAGEILDEAPEGRSQVSDRAVFETIQWIMPSMMRIFAGGDNVVEFDPVGPDDEDVAEQESDYLNYLVMQKGDWELVVREWVQDALLSKNSYCLVDMEERLTPEIERYEGQREEQLTLLLEDDVEVVGQDQYNDPDDEGVLIDPATQQPIDPQDEATMTGAMVIYQATGMEPQKQYRQLYDVELKRVKAEKRLNLDVLAPERCRVGQDTKDFTLETCNFFEYWDDTMTISDLRKLGYEIDDDIADEPYGETEEDSARSFNLESRLMTETPDKSMRQVTVRTIWIRYDYDEDGIAELQRVVRVGHEILNHEPASRIPVACLTPYINTHRHTGISVADLIFDIQRIKTSLLRSGLDSLNLSTRPQHAISNKVNIDDMLQNIPGGVKRVNTDMADVQGHIVPLITQDTFPSAQAGMAHMDTVVESRVGVNRTFQGIDVGSMSGNNEHNAIGQLSSMAAQRIEDMAKLFGTGFKRLFSLAHELVIKSGHQAETVKLRGKWVDMDPSQWRTGRDMRVTAPFSAGNKDSLLQRLMIVAGIQEKMLAGGLPTVDQQNVYNLALEISKAADLPGNKFFTDPSTKEPAPPKPDPVMMAVEIEGQKVQVDMQKVEQQAADSQLDAEVKKYQTDKDAYTKEVIARINSETQIALAQLKDGQAINLEQFKANLKAQEPKPDVKLATNELRAITENASNKTSAALEKAMGKLAEAVETMGAEKELIRDKDDKVIGARIKRKGT